MGTAAISRPEEVVREYVAVNGQTRASVHHLLMTFGLRERDDRRQLEAILTKGGISVDRRLVGLRS